MTPALIICATLLAVDGDTIKCDGQNMRLLGDGAPYVAGVDTPETSQFGRAQCLAESMLADLATQRLNQILQTPGIAIEDSGGTDSRDRPLVTIRLPDGGTAGQRLIDEGYAVVWLPDQTVNWCSEPE